MAEGTPGRVFGSPNRKNEAHKEVNLEQEVPFLGQVRETEAKEGILQVEIATRGSRGVSSNAPTPTEGKAWRFKTIES